MKTISYGCIHLPLLTRYRDSLFIWKTFDLSKCVIATAVKLIFQNALRTVLLCVWGFQNINYNYPLSSQKMIAVYIEIATLGVGVFIGGITLMAYFYKKIPLLYPALVSIPLCFLIDFGLKATCYAYLFLYPYITLFGIFSLIELWWRHITLLYHWVLLISFIYTSKDFVDPFTGKQNVQTPTISTVHLPDSSNNCPQSINSAQELQQSPSKLTGFKNVSNMKVSKSNDSDLVGRNKKYSIEASEFDSILKDVNSVANTIKYIDDDAASVASFNQNQSSSSSKLVKKSAFIPPILRKNHQSVDISQVNLKEEKDKNITGIKFAPKKNYSSGDNNKNNIKKGNYNKNNASKNTIT